MLFVVVLDVGRAVVGDVTRVDVQLAVQERAEFAQLVQDDEDRRPLRLGVGDDLCEARSRCRVDSGHRLVHDEQLGASHEGARDEDALCLPAREDVERGVGAVGHADAFEGGHGLRRVARQRPQATRPEQAGSHDLDRAGANRAARGDALGYVADLVPWHASARGNRATEELGVAACDGRGAQQGLQGRGLARSVRARDRHGLAGGDVERDPVEDQVRIPGHVQVVETHDGGRLREGGSRRRGVVSRCHWQSRAFVRASMLEFIVAA